MHLEYDDDMKADEIRGYDEIEYWNGRIDPNSATRECIADLIKFIQNWVPDGGNVLDFGPGVGRIFPAYERASSVVGVDVSTLYVKRLFKAAEKYNFKFHHVITSQRAFPFFIEKRFDIAVACMVLLHLRPDILGDIMLGLGRVAEKVLVFTWSSERPDISPAPHCYNHDYRYWCKELSLNVLSWGMLGYEKLGFVYEIQGT